MLGLVVPYQSVRAQIQIQINRSRWAAKVPRMFAHECSHVVPRMFASVRAHLSTFSNSMNNFIS